MEEKELLPHLFRTEYRKLISVLCKLFGIEYIALAEDIVSDTFLQASETWGLKGLPKNPTAWLYTVSKNKAIDVLKHNKLFAEKIALELKATAIRSEENGELEIDLSQKNIHDSQLQMMFAICDSCISKESQIGLSLSILCGFGIDEIADAFLSNKETIYKRLARAKEKLKEEKIKIELPSKWEITKRLETVLTTVYLLFNEGYYSSSNKLTLRKELCLEAIRLTVMLTETKETNTTTVNALLSLMCFHSSRFEARIDMKGEIILYEDQDESKWNKELIERGKYYLNCASKGNALSKYHLEAAIAYWHTNKADSKEKWESILELYNKLLQIEYSPIAALNRTYALSKVNGKMEAIEEAEKLNLTDNLLYHTLLSNLYTDIDNGKSINHLKLALTQAKTITEKEFIEKQLKSREASSSH